LFSEGNDRWVDHLVWTTMDVAKASEKVTEDAEAAALFARFDPDSVVFSRYEKIESQ
jgi:hypothetical protein